MLLNDRLPLCQQCRLGYGNKFVPVRPLLLLILAPKLDILPTRIQPSDDSIGTLSCEFEIDGTVEHRDP